MILETCRRYVSVSQRLTTLLASVAGIAMITVMLVLVGNVVGRAFGAPLDGAYELASLASVVLFGLSLGYAQTKDSQASVDILVERMSVRPRIVLGALVAVGSTFLFAQLFTALVVYALNQRDRAVATEALTIPTWPAVLLLAGGIGALIVALVADLAKARIAWSSDDPDVSIF